MLSLLSYCLKRLTLEGTQGEWKTIVKFSKRLLLLYGFWCIVWSPIVYIQNDYLHDFSALSVLLFVRDFFFGSIFDASWFLGALLVGILLVWLLVKALEKRLFWIVPFMIYLYVIYADDLPAEYQVVNYWYTANVCEDGMWLSFPSGLIWISIGYLLSTNNAVETFSKWNNRLVWLASLASIGLLFCKVPLVNILAVVLLFISAYTWRLPEHPALYSRADIQHPVLRHPRLFQENTQATLCNRERTGAVRHNHSLLLPCIRVYHKDEGRKGLWVVEVCLLILV